MRKISRDEILPLSEYDRSRDASRPAILRIKDDRRIHLGGYLTFLFENRDTVKYQIQEMLRAERIAGESEIEHEIATYNELLGDQGELGCTLFVEIEDPSERERLLSEWLGLPGHLYIQTLSGTRVRASFDPRQVGDERISSVHYLKFRLGDEVPAILGCDHPALRAETPLTARQAAALAKDLVER